MDRNGNENAVSGEGPGVPEGVAVDWFTTVLTDASARDKARFRTQLWQQAEQRYGNYPTPFSLAGHTGISCGGLSYGDSRRSTVIQVSGGAARRLYGAVAALGGRPSRVDLQGTYRLGVAALNPALQAYGGGRASRRVGRSTTARTLIQGTDGGFTCYVGSASSEVRLRVYDKGVESGTCAPGILWRWELQARREHARALCSGLDAADNPADFIDSALRGHCLKVGVEYPSTFGVSVHIYDISRTSSNAIDTLHWLDTSVRPCISRLLQYCGSGPILAALGLLESEQNSTNQPLT